MENAKHREDKLRRHCRDARNATVWAFFAICILEVIGAILIDWCPLDVRFPHAATVVEAFKAPQRPAEIVCLGSSRFGCSIDDRRVQGHLRSLTGDASVQAFNASVAGGDLVTSALILSHLVSAGTPRIVVIEITPEYICRKNRWLAIHLTRELTWRGIAPFLPDVISSGALSRFASSRLVPWYRHRSHFREWLVECVSGSPSPSQRVILPWMRSDWIAPSHPHDMAALEATRTNLRGYRKWLQDYEIGGGPALFLGDLLRLCRDRNIRALLVGAPLSSSHRALYTPQIEESFGVYMRDLNQKYGCAFIDLRSSVPDSEFSDSHHVDEAGRIRFSEILAREILSPELDRFHHKDTKKTKTSYDQ
ncbi:MAG TPA: hypothetical protein VGK99_09290 [Acidobacteriota bacterium]|jgi:hypothetical protein